VRRCRRCSAAGERIPIETRRRLVDAEVQRLEALGATLVRVICEDGVDHYARNDAVIGNPPDAVQLGCT
jgi:protein-L-isoaspartate O-methyltransferase